MRVRTPLGYHRHRDPRHYRFPLPNEVWQYKLRPTEFLIFSYLCYRKTHGQVGDLSPEEIADGLHLSTATVIDQMIIGDAYNIVVPYNQLREQPPIPDSVLRIPSPLKPFSVVIKFIKTRADVVQIDFLSPPTVYPLHAVKLASGEKLWVVYYYTVDLNTVIESAYQRLTNIALSVKPKDPLKLTSGFVSVEDSKKRQYHIDFWLDSLEQ